MTKRDILIVLILNTTWGTSFAFSKYTMEFFTPVFLYGLRFFTTGLILVPFMKFDKKDFKSILLLSFLQAITFFGISLCVKNIDSSTTAILARLDIVFTIIISSFIFKEKLNLKTFIGIFICFFAIYVISGNLDFSKLEYILLIIFSSFCGGYANIVAKKIKNTKNTSIVAWSSFFMGIFLFIASFFMENTFILKKLNFNAYLSLLYLGIFSSYITYLILYYLVKKYEAKKIMPYNFLRPIVSVVFGFILLGEEITIRKVLGMILILVGIYISQYRYNRKNYFIKNIRVVKYLIKKKKKIQYRLEI